MRERLGGAPISPVQVWLLSPPPHSMGESGWFVLALAALNAMLKFRGVFESGGAKLVRGKASDLLDRVWQDFLASQL